MLSNKDYIITAILGFLTGSLTILILSYLNLYFFSYQNAFIIIGFPILWLVWIKFSELLGNYFSPLYLQFGKYVAAGFLSASIDFSILNSISYFTGVTAGIIVGWVNIPGFLFGVTHAYLWNKYWVFKTDGKTLGFGTSLKPSVEKSVVEELGGVKEPVFDNFPKFILVAVIGLLINSTVIVILTTYIRAPYHLTPAHWLNLAKIIATAIIVFWNFIGYKFVVFRKPY